MSRELMRMLLIATTALYYISFILFFINSKWLRRIRKKADIQKESRPLTIAAAVTWIAGALINGSIVIYNWVSNGYVPFVGTFQVLIFLSMCFPFVFFYVSYMYKGKWMASHMVLTAAICMTGVLAMGVRSAGLLPPALQSIWFIPHILTYMISYSLFAVSFVIIVARYLSPKEDHSRMDRGTYSLICAAFPFATMGMFFGAIWANEIWGAFWSWDGKENWSLVTWVLHALYLHFYRVKPLRKYANFLVIVGFIALIITMFFVNFFYPQSLHVYS